MKKIVFIILLLIPLAVSSQKEEGKYSVKGNLKVVVGNNLVLPADNPMIWIKKTKNIVFCDSLGNFHFENFQKGKYHIEVGGYGYKADTIIEIVDKSIQNLTLLADPNCDVNSIVAESDIKNNGIKLLLIGSIVPIMNTEEDNQFEKTFRLKYYDYGCTPPAIECVMDYNQRVFEYLDSQYGKNWRKSVRKDVPGLKEYNKKKK